MRMNLFIKVVAIALASSTTSYAHEYEKVSTAKTSCSLNQYCTDGGFLPENHLKIPVNSFNANKMTQDQFNSILDKIEQTYSPIIRSKGGQLTIQRDWTDGTVNAYATREGATWILKMFGGLARHPEITEDGFALVACHELGHHLGGSPKYPGEWAAAEGAADYFATLKCLRKVWENDDNSSIISHLNISPLVQKECEKSFSDIQLISVCIRSAYAGLSSAKLSIALGAGSSADFSTPDPKVVSTTDTGHPEAQCRLDTYLNGGICQVAWNEELSETDPTVGSCAMEKGAKFGYRPLCWYKPADTLPNPTPTPSPTPSPTPTPIPSPEPTPSPGGVTQQPTISGLTQAIASPYEWIPVDFDVSNIKEAQMAYFEVVGPDREIEDPNGVIPSQGRIFWQLIRFTHGKIYLNPVTHFPYYGTYSLRVIPIDGTGHSAVGRFSNATTLIIR